MKKSIIVAALFALPFAVPTIALGQYADQALKLSLLSYGGTARFTGMGGAFGAIGGDFSTLSINPAGIGVYKNSEVSITPLIYNTRSFSEYVTSKEYKTNQEEFRTRLNINNAGFIFAMPVSNNDFKVVQFGIGYNRLANFNNSIYFEGFNPNNSFLRALSDDATVAKKNGQFDSKNPWYINELADAVNLFEYDPATGFHPDRPDKVNQSAWIQQEGGIDELAFTFGANYADKLFFGATLGVPFMSFWQFYQYEEWDPYGQDKFRGMRYDETYESNGAGVNGKFGVIYKPIAALRVGAAIHTPTYYWLIQESEWMSMTSSFKDSTHWNRTMATERVFEYSQTTPMRIIGSVAYIAGKKALISADYEWVDHSTNKLQPSREQVMNDSNRDIRKFYGTQHIIRTGAELRLRDFYLRGGYGWYSSPFQDTKVNDMSLNTWSLGAGFRAGAFGLDFAFQHAQSKSKYYPYDADRYNSYNNESSVSPYANLTNKANSYILTFSYRY